MGSWNSKGSGRFSPSSSYGSRASSAWEQNPSQSNYQYPYPAPQGYPPAYTGYSSSSPYYEPGEPPPPPPPSYPASNMQSQRRLDRRYSRITDDYSSLDQVTDALSRSGLESSNLIVGIDFTKSNEWTGKVSYNNRSLHYIGEVQNPYEQAISIIGKTLSAFDEDNLIPCFGFGDALTHDKDVFSFYPDERPCNGFGEALSRYREIAPHLNLAGPTSFAPIIEMAMTIVEQSGGQYHVLVIIADGQVTRSVDTAVGHLSSQEKDTIDAIVKASEYPLSIILVGVGDGPWDMMREFDDNIPARAFDNFQFVNFTEIMSRNVPPSKKETEFALSALMEIPSQYKATIELKILGRQKGESPERVPLPPRLRDNGSSFYPPKTSQYSSFPKDTPSYPAHGTYVPTAPPASSASSSRGNQECPICLSNPKDMAFGCGHQTCSECGPSLSTCPICRSPIQTRIKLY